jgi:hypothetical protein
VVRYKTNGHFQLVIACCKSMRTVFENKAWELISFDPDDGHFFECRDSADMSPANWRRHLFPQPPLALRKSVLAKITRMRKPTYVEVHRRRVAV